MGVIDLDHVDATSCDQFFRSADDIVREVRDVHERKAVRRVEHEVASRSTPAHVAGEHRSIEELKRLEGRSVLMGETFPIACELGALIGCQE
jgi:hypothetical protein